MDSLIRETNENLKSLIETMKSNLDSSLNALDNLQMQMDKKVEEAKKYKIQVDGAKDKIKEYEESNKSLEISLKELNDKYGKMNLVSLVEAGNKEIKTKINDNNREINKLKESIADLTNKARTIKDLLINLKKDKTIKEERLENIKVVYEYYNSRINDICDYAHNHSENLGDYKDNYSSFNYDNDIDVNVSEEIENTMVFDEIANIDDNSNFKDEMTFVDEQINETINDENKINELIRKSLEKYDDKVEEVKVNEDKLDSTQVFDSIFEDSMEDNKEIEEDKSLDESFVVIDDNNENEINEIDSVDVVDKIKPLNEELFIVEEEGLKENEEDNKDIEENVSNEQLADVSIVNDINNPIDDSVNSLNVPNLDVNTNDINFMNKLNINDNLDTLKIEDDLDYNESEDRISKINDLFSEVDSTKTSNLNLDNINKVSGIEKEIDNAYLDVFGKPLEENDLNKKESTLTDIFGNPIKNDELSEDVKKQKVIEDFFVENGIDFNKFKDDEKNYLKQIYDVEKFESIINTLKRNKINLDNLYYAFNIFGEISADELDGIIGKLLNCGQSVEAIGLILEKLPKVKKYNLDEAIISYGDYIKDIDITELIMKAKELYDGGNN